ncbi:DUF6059 family protein [Streptomyces qinzhouensis]|uniref:Uncharacterized protein n=1 Tax=Streptomyces qinzhouensis TaxID=2599401 RepID=A0A5B8JJ45_9ACTN|nr:DUF6059 family protein [Streptomyces qinzhouensis]QDY80444.1 hypothetical protein FQU76_32400 [Streptomyces qinzhouensis]
MTGRLRRTARICLIPLHSVYRALSLYGRIWAPVPPDLRENPAGEPGTPRRPRTPPGHPERICGPTPRTAVEAAIARQLDEIFRGDVG